jgi:hypothetical protein
MVVSLSLKGLITNIRRPSRLDSCATCRCRSTRLSVQGHGGTSRRGGMACCAQPAPATLDQNPLDARRQVRAHLLPVMAPRTMATSCPGRASIAVVGFLESLRPRAWNACKSSPVMSMDGGELPSLAAICEYVTQDRNHLVFSLSPRLFHRTGSFVACRSTISPIFIEFFNPSHTL